MIIAEGAEFEYDVLATVARRSYCTRSGAAAVLASAGATVLDRQRRRLLAPSGSLLLPFCFSSTHSVKVVISELPTYTLVENFSFNLVIIR